MESKRHDDLDGELDIQALLDKYLPEEQTGSDEDLPAEDSAELTDEEFFDDEVVTEEAQDAPDGKEELYMKDVAEDEQESFDDFVISDDSADDGASGKDFYDAYKEFSDNVESGDTKDDTALDWGAVTEDNSGENTESAADAVLKLDDDDDINQLMLGDMLNVKSDKKSDGEEIAVYYAYGSIVDNNTMDLLSGTDHKIVGKTTAEDLRKLADDDDVKAVVFRVNSGGGSAVASEQIRHAIKLIKAKKPVVVSMGGMAASGGYWISSPANYIFAEPTTITGSIGIFGLIPNASGLITDKLGITFDGVTTNKYTDYETDLVLGKNPDEAMKYLQTYIDRGYQSFLNIVSEGRGMKPAEVDSIAQGRVWLATDALKIKLVDKLGSLDDAVKKAAELAKLDDYHTATYPAQGSWMDQFMPKENKGSYLDSKLQQELKALFGDLYEPMMELRQIVKDGSHVQARMMDDVRVK